VIRTLPVLALIVAVVADLGICVGRVHFSPGSDVKNAHITVSMDKVQDLGQQAKDKVENTTQTAQE